jgi:membrane-associated phospholipid phosphatase
LQCLDARPERFAVSRERWRPGAAAADAPSWPPPWYRQVGARARQHILLKSIGTPTAIFMFFVAYGYLLNHPQFPVTEMPLTGLDRLVGFCPAALLLYVSLWAYVSLPPALLQSREELLQYAWTIGALCAAGLLCFLVWPTSVPHSGVDRGSHLGFNALQRLDAAGNAFPSLHVAAALFSAVWLEVLLREMGAGRLARGASWGWSLGIVYSAMATKQHVALDVYAGAFLGLGAGLLAVRRREGYVRATTARREACEHRPVG